MSSAIETTTGQAPLRLGFQTHLHGEEPARELYPAVVDLFVAAEELGFDTGWVAQHHFSRDEGRLPSPLPFLAAVAASTSRIRLGTTVVTLSLEDPVRVAEDASVVDALSNGRLELGIGSGNPQPGQFAAFGRDVGRRHEIFADHAARLRSALSGDEVAPGLRLEPPALGLADRLWEAPLTRERVEAAARRGSGVLLGIGPGRSVQLDLAHAYRDAAEQVGVHPRIAVVHSAFFGPSAESVVGELSPGLRSGSLDYYVEAGWVGRDAPPGDLLTAMNVHHGTPADVAASLRDQPVLDFATDLVLAVQSRSTSIARAVRALETIATEVRPALDARRATLPPRRR